MTNSEILTIISSLKVHKVKLKIFLSNHYPEVLKAIYENTSFLDENNPENWEICFAERLYCIRHDLKERKKCETCN